MSTFWLKVAAVAVVVLGSIVAVISFLPSSKKSPPKTFYDVAEQDREKFLSKPEPVSPTESETPTPEHKPNEKTSASRFTGTEHELPESPKTITLYFSELSEIENIEAERLLNVAVPGRSIGRLPGPGFKLMVDSCRQIIDRWPESWYAYRAKQMLADMPERFRPRYDITEEELDMSRFAEPRPGTKPFVVEKSE